MKKYLFIWILIGSFFSCKVTEKPVFVKVGDLKVLSVKSDNITLGANAFFKNPNDIGGQLETKGIKIWVNGAELAHVSTKTFKVPKKSEFFIPLKVEIPTKRIFDKNKNNILQSLLNTVLNKTISVELKGEIKYKFLGFSHKYMVDQKEDVKIKF